jgi:hypothetical protein
LRIELAAEMSEESHVAIEKSRECAPLYIRRSHRRLAMRHFEGAQRIPQLTPINAVLGTTRDQEMPSQFAATTVIRRIAARTCPIARALFTPRVSIAPRRMYRHGFREIHVRDSKRLNWPGTDDRLCIFALLMAPRPGRVLAFANMNLLAF